MHILHNQCKKLNEISDIIKRPTTTVSRIIKRYGETKKLQNAKRISRKQILNDRDIRFIARKIEKKNLLIPATCIAKELNIKLNVNTNVGVHNVRNVMQ